MNENPKIGPEEALDKLFQIIREEAESNPRFARRLLEAVGYNVQFRGNEAFAAIDPILVALKGPEEFRRTFVSMTAAQIKKVGLASGLFVRGNQYPGTVGELVDALWSRAKEKVDDQFPESRQAAE